MNENSQIKHSLAVQALDSNGRIKSERYVKDGIEFVPNKIYIYLRNHGIIESDTFKIPFLLGSRNKRG